MSAVRSLDDQRREFTRRRLIAMPIAGTLAWTAAGIAGALLRPGLAALAIFVCTGMIAYLGMFISNYTGENFLDKTKPKNSFDSLFFHTVAQALCVYAIAIPFYRMDVTSLPMTVGILTGLMWIPMSWILQHWIGIAHTVVRTFGVVAVWYLFPTQRFVTIPVVIVLTYAFTIVVLEQRWRAVNGIGASATVM